MSIPTKPTEKDKKRAAAVQAGQWPPTEEPEKKLGERGLDEAKKRFR